MIIPIVPLVRVFGDGAAAFMLEPTREDMGVMDAVLRTDGKGLPFFNISKQEVPYVLHLTIHWTIGCIIFIRKDVQSLNMLWTNMADACEAVMERNHLTKEDIDWVIPH